MQDFRLCKKSSFPPLEEEKWDNFMASQWGNRLLSLYYTVNENSELSSSS